MDTFIDQLSQKFTAQEIIKANCAADAMELEQMRERAGQYEVYLDELKSFAPATQETLQQIQNVQNNTVATFDQLRQVQDDTTATFSQLRQVQDNTTEAFAHIQEVQESTSEAFTNIKQIQNETAATYEQLRRMQEQTAETIAGMQNANSNAQEVMARMEQMNAASMENILRMEKINEIAGANAAKMERTIELGLDKIQSAQINTDGIDELVASGIKKINDMQQGSEELESAMKDSTKAQSEELRDFFHKESVKVYRNVQAITLEELAKQTESLEGEFKKLNGKMTITMIMAIAAAVASIANIVLRFI